MAAAETGVVEPEFPELLADVSPSVGRILEPECEYYIPEARRTGECVSQCLAGVPGTPSGRHAAFLEWLIDARVENTNT
jgi:hypothetical protein